MTDEKQKNENMETVVDEMQVRGSDLVERVKELMEQGNVRRLVIRRSNGEELMQIPLTASVIAGGAMVVFAPMLAAVGAMAALLAEVKIEIVREIPADKPKNEDDIA
ncbi:MAG: DUF4342 domain-containing protein [Aggregatilineales bacterium]